MNKFQKRINYKGNLSKVLEQVSKDYQIGNYASHKVIETGYEDFNVVLTTDKGKFFVKMFATFRNRKDCERYVNMMVTVLKAGISHPELLSFPEGHLYVQDFDGTEIRLVVMEYIDGETLYDSRETATLDDAEFFVEQAALINKIRLDTPFVYDSWAVVNFLKEYGETRDIFPNEDKEAIDPIAKEFEKIDIKSLPYSFVHGDIIKTNVIRSSSGKLYILDFSVANNYPRVQELAVLLCNLLYDENSLDSFMNFYNMALDQYNKSNELTQQEIKIMPLYLKAAHAMHILGAGKEKYTNGEDSEENEYWLSQGRKGLQDMNKIFTN